MRIGVFNMLSWRGLLAAPVAAALLGFGTQAGSATLRHTFMRSADSAQRRDGRRQSQAARSCSTTTAGLASRHPERDAVHCNGIGWRPLSLKNFSAPE